MPIDTSSPPSPAPDRTGPFSYGRAKHIIDLRTAYQDMSDSLFRDVDIAVPLRLRNGTVIQFKGKGFPTDALLLSWYGIPELFRQYWQDCADIVGCNPYRIDADVYCDPDPSSTVVPESTFAWQNGEGVSEINPGYAHYSNVVETSGIYPLDTFIAMRHVKACVTQQDKNFLIAPGWHGSKDDGFYPVRAYTELLDAVNGLNDQMTPIQTGDLRHTLGNTYYDTQTVYDWAWWPYMPLMEGRETVRAVMAFEFVNMTDKIVEYPISLSGNTLNQPEGGITGIVSAYLRMPWDVEPDSDYLSSDIIKSDYQVARDYGTVSFQSGIRVLPGKHIRGGLAVEIYNLTATTYTPACSICVGAPDSLGRKAVDWATSRIDVPPQYLV